MSMPHLARDRRPEGWVMTKEQMAAIGRIYGQMPLNQGLSAGPPGDPAEVVAWLVELSEKLRNVSDQLNRLERVEREFQRTADALRLLNVLSGQSVGHPVGYGKELGVEMGREPR